MRQNKATSEVADRLDGKAVVPVQQEISIEEQSDLEIKNMSREEVRARIVELNEKLFVEQPPIKLKAIENVNNSKDRGLK